MRKLGGENLIKYKIIYDLPDSWWEVVLSIEKITFKVNLISENKLNNKKKVESEQNDPN